MDEYQDLLSQQVIGAYAPIEETGWGLIVEHRTVEVFHEIDQLRLLVIILILVAVLIVGGLAVLISNSITRPIMAIADISDQVARGEIPETEIVVTGKDEIALMQNAFKSILEYFKQIADFSSTIATGDLTAAIQAKSDRDIVGTSLGQMVEQFKTIVIGLMGNVKKIDQSSAMLADTAEHVDRVSGQISTTIQQVAKGSSQQAESITRTSSSVDELAKAIDGVAKGAQEQAVSIAAVTVSIDNISKTLDNVTEKLPQRGHRIRLSPTGSPAWIRYGQKDA